MKFFISLLFLMAYSTLLAQSDFTSYLTNQTLTALTGEEQTPIIALHQDGSMLSISVDATTQLPKEVVFFENLGEQPVVMYFDQTASPIRMYYGGYSFLFNKKTDSTFQVGVIKPDGSTDIINRIEIMLPRLERIKDSIILTMPKVGPSNKFSIAPPEFDILSSALNGLKYAGTALSAFSCGAALIPPLGATLILPCAAAVLDVYTNYFNKDAAGAVATAEVLNAAGNYEFFTTTKNSQAFLELQKLSGKATVAGVLVFGVQKALETIKSQRNEQKEKSFLDDMNVEYESDLNPDSHPIKSKVTVDTLVAKGIFDLATEADEKVAQLKQDQEKLNKSINQSNYNKVQPEIEKIQNQIKGAKAEYKDKITLLIKNSPKIMFPFKKYDYESGYRVHSITLGEMVWCGDHPCFSLNWEVSVNDKKRVNENGYKYFERVAYIKGDLIVGKGTKDKIPFTLAVGGKENYQIIKYGGKLDEIKKLQMIHFVDSQVQSK